MSHLKQVSQRRRDLTAGYLRENTQQNRHNWPEALTYLISSLFEKTTDSFDPNKTHPSLHIDRNCLIDDSGIEGIRNSYLRNIVFEGVHTWTFQYERHDSDTNFGEGAIGIARVFGNGEWAPLEQFVDTCTENYLCGFWISTAGYRSQGCANPDGVEKLDKKKYQIANTDVIIEMQLDLNSRGMTVKFKINGENVACFERISVARYRAVVSMCEGDERIKLISYDKF